MSHTSKEYPQDSITLGSRELKETKGRNKEFLFIPVNYFGLYVNVECSRCLVIFIMAIIVANYRHQNFACKIL